MVVRAFRCGRPLSSGSQLSRFGCACRVSILPLFPRESSVLVLRCTALFDDGWVVFNVHLRLFFLLLEWRVVVGGPFRSAAVGRFPAGSQLSRFGCACRVSTLPLFPRESAVLRCTALFDG
ncbi:hypothetical protein [Rossellomorea marisflavi]|uniref:hypothetical protein n=1 Tax=Rossellomorea marisflavi TaxID=189381 RepID=UPI001EE2E7E3|nr:hypothetical protein [Rossellomorea marisflavi]UKS64725.1 hypothetical protein K6T23_18420 [Rossellomorea marisflavi]